METLLVIAIVVTALAVLVQAGVLVAMFVMARRLASRVDGLIAESQRIMAPMEDVSRNLRSTSDDLAEIGKLAREQLRHAESMMQDVRNRITESIDEIRGTVMGPVRKGSAIARGVAEGVRVLFRRRAPEGARQDTAA